MSGTDTTPTRGPGKHDELYANARVPKRFRKAKVSSSRLNRDAVDKVERYVEALDRNLDRGIGFTLVGPAGVGKTRIVCAALCRAIDQGHSAVFWKFEELLRLQRQVWDDGDAWKASFEDAPYRRWEKNRNLLVDVRNRYEFVVIDDIGKEHHTTSAFAKDEFDFLLRYRFDKALPTIMTSNLNMADIGNLYGDAMKSFIKEASPLITCLGEDARR